MTTVFVFQSDASSKSVFSKVMVITSTFCTLRILSQLRVFCLLVTNTTISLNRESSRPGEGPGLCEEAGSGSGGRRADSEPAGYPGQPGLLLQAGRGLCGKDLPSSPGWISFANDPCFSMKNVAISGELLDLIDFILSYPNQTFTILC